MANQQHLECLKQGVARWNQWRNQNPDKQPDLEGVNLEGATLEGIHFEKAKLTGANLKWTSLWGAYFTKAELTETDLRMADLTESHLKGANLTKADLRGAVLVGADFREACLANTDLNGANMTGAKLYKVICEGWIIDGIVCAYIFNDPDGSTRYPAWRNFRLKEFEKGFRHPLPVYKTSNRLLQQILHGLSSHAFLQMNKGHLSNQDIPS